MVSGDLPRHGLPDETPLSRTVLPPNGRGIWAPQTLRKIKARVERHLCHDPDDLEAPQWTRIGLVALWEWWELQVLWSGKSRV